MQFLTSVLSPCLVMYLFFYYIHFFAFFLLMRSTLFYISVKLVAHMSTCKFCTAALRRSEGGASSNNLGCYMIALQILLLLLFLYWTFNSRGPSSFTYLFHNFMLLFPFSDWQKSNLSTLFMLLMLISGEDGGSFWGFSFYMDLRIIVSGVTVLFLL